MKLSAKAEYGLRALLELALQTGKAPAQAKVIARRQGIPHRFLEQVLNSLRKAGLVESIRGAQGGYTLSRDPAAIRISDVLEAVEDGISSPGRSNGNPESQDDLLAPIWKEAQTAVSSVLNRFTIQDLCKRQRDLEQARVMMFHI
ncbi:MAG TPA: Rrf2 family transcriptional regulator [Nitrospiria bacterium]|nr:Rrf2 family transcriptional regulator [Nitrospiria bacterium]